MEEQKWQEEWAGLEPEQPRSGQCGCWLGAFVLLLALLGTCLGTAFFAWQQLDLPIDPGEILVPATAAPLATPPPIDGGIIGTPVNASIATQPPFAATVTLPSSDATEPEADEEDVEAQSLANPPLIDGNLDEWAGIPTYESSYRVFTAENWDRTEDVRAFWRLGWDRNNLYAAVVVEDDIHVQTQRGNSIFKGDGVSIQLDTQFEADFGPRLSQDDFQINLSPGDFVENPPVAIRFRGDNSGNLIDMVGHGIQVAAKRSASGYTLEAAIPWSNLGITPETGLQMGIALNVNDNDTPGTALQEVMMSQVSTRRFSDPTSWGKIVFRESE